MNWTSSVSRMRFENEEELRRIKIEPNIDEENGSDVRSIRMRTSQDIDDDETTQLLYPENTNQTAESIELSDDEVTIIREFDDDLIKNSTTNMDGFEDYLKDNGYSIRYMLITNNEKDEFTTSITCIEDVIDIKKEIDEENVNNDEQEKADPATSELPKEAEKEINNSLNNTAPIKKKKTKTDPSGKLFFKCKICTCYFAYLKTLQKHVKKFHKSEKIDNNKVQYNSKCKFCAHKSKFDNYNHHIKTSHKEKYTNESKTTPKIKIANNTNKKKSYKKSIPKSVLFQCKKCSVHFLNVKFGIKHVETCGESLGNDLIVACPACHRRFVNNDFKNHVKQHEHCNKFTTHYINQNIIDRILYKCPSCDICYNDKKFNYHKRSCSKTDKKIDCPNCGIVLAEESLGDHLSKHKVLGDSFVLIEVINL